MAISKYLNRVYVNTITTGTGSLTLGNAVNGYFTALEAGGAENDIVSYTIIDGNNIEVGVGTLGAGAGILSRDTVYLSKISGTAGTTKLTLSGNAKVLLTVAAEDLEDLSLSDWVVSRFATTGDGSAGPYDIGFTPLDEQHLTVFVGGVYQDDFSLTGSNITFGFTIPNGIDITGSGWVGTPGAIGYTPKRYKWTATAGQTTFLGSAASPSITKPIAGKSMCMVNVDGRILLDDEFSLSGVDLIYGSNDIGAGDIVELTVSTSYIADTSPGVPVGMVLFSPKGTVPTGFLACEGGTFDQAVYPALYTYLGTNSLPDFRNRVPRGEGNLTSSSGSTQEDAFQGHRHALVNTGQVVANGSGSAANLGAGGSMVLTSIGDPITDGTNGTPRTASETRVKAYIGKFVIKAFDAVLEPVLVDVGNLANNVQTLSNATSWRRAVDVILEDQQTQNTAGGTFTSGADQTRVLNTKVYDPSSYCSLASNQFTLPAGTWLIEWSAPASHVDGHQSFLYNITSASVVARGTSEFVSPTSVAYVTRSIGSTVITIPASRVFEIRHRCQTTRATSGFGLANNFGTEIYTRVQITKQAL